MSSRNKLQTQKKGPWILKKEKQGKVTSSPSLFSVIIIWCKPLWGTQSKYLALFLEMLNINLLMRKQPYKPRLGDILPIFFWIIKKCQYHII